MLYCIKHIQGIDNIETRVTNIQAIINCKFCEELLLELLEKITHWYIFYIEYSLLIACGVWACRM